MSMFPFQIDTKDETPETTAAKSEKEEKERKESGDGEIRFEGAQGGRWGGLGGGSREES